MATVLKKKKAQLKEMLRRSNLKQVDPSQKIIKKVCSDTQIKAQVAKGETNVSSDTKRK